MAKQMLTALSRCALTTAPVLADVQLDYWADIWMQIPACRRRDFSLERFLGATDQVRADGERLARLAAREQLEQEQRPPYQLTSKEQAALREALRRSVRVIDNGRRIEKLTHHRHPRRGFRDFIKAAE